MTTREAQPETDIRRHEADGARTVVWRSADGSEYRLSVSRHDPHDDEFTFDVDARHPDEVSLVCTNLTAEAVDAVRWALEAARGPE